jgi:hypothetical protein
MTINVAPEIAIHTVADFDGCQCIPAKHPIRRSEKLQKKTKNG